jgi:hypothetical protein
MVGLKAEAVLLVEPAREWSEELVRHFDDDTAHIADEVLVRVIEQVVHRAPMPQVDVIDDAELLERVERAVDGRAVDVGLRALHDLSEILGRDVGLGLDEGRHESPSRGRDPTTALPQSIEDAVEPSGLHKGDGSRIQV